MPKLKEPSIRSIKYVNNTLSGMNKKKAALSAGYSPATAHNASRAIETVPVARTIQEALEKQGITSDVIAKGIREGMEAVRLETIAGEVVTNVDFAVRYRYLELSLKLLLPLIGNLKQAPTPIMGGLSSMSEDELKKILATFQVVLDS